MRDELMNWNAPLRKGAYKIEVSTLEHHFFIKIGLYHPITVA